MRNKIETNKDEIIELYVNGKERIDIIAEKYHVGKKKIRQILLENGVVLRKKGELNTKFKKYDSNTKKYIPTENKTFIAISKIDGKIFNDYNNNSGCLTSYIKNELNVELPSLKERHNYFIENGDYWYEQYFDIVEIEKKEVITKKCPYCDWKTIDINNKSGAFEQHLINVHGIRKKEYLKEFPQEVNYFKVKNKTLNRQFENDKDKFVVCKVCGKKLSRLDSRHLSRHGLTKKEYIEKYHSETLSNDYKKFLSDKMKEQNKTMDNHFKSNGENKIRDFILSHGIECFSDRKILKGKELDILVPSKNIAIEYNGNKWHTERFGGKDRYYHLNKTILCQKQNIRLIQVFEDEYELHKDIVLNKIAHVLNIDLRLPKIMARKCVIKVIDKETAKLFLNSFHIQGYSRASLYLGAFYNGELIGVMSFKREQTEKWELTRFATNYNFICSGVGGKLFKYFVKEYNPTEVKSFADRRWTINSSENLYTKLGFKLVQELKPDYRYYNPSIDRYMRFHKFGFRKNILHKKYNLPLNLTESEMTEKLNFDRIWDCGLLKYVWKMVK